MGSGLRELSLVGFLFSCGGCERGPRGVAAEQVGDVAEAVGAQGAGGDAGAVAASAVRGLGTNLREVRTQLVADSLVLGRGARDVAETSSQLHEHPLHVGQRVAVGSRCFRVGHAPRQPRSHQQKSGLIERFARRRNLHDDVTTISTVGEHLLDAANLTLDLAQTSSQISQHIF